MAEKEFSLQFAAALEEALGRSGLSVKKLAAAAAVNEGKLYAWLKGANAPAVESFPDIRRVEEVLSLERDTLTGKVLKSQTKSFSPKVYPTSITVDGEKIKVRKNKSILGKLRPLLPDDYDERSEEEREEIATWLVKNLIRPTDEWGRWHRTILGVQYALKVLPPSVEKEYRECVHFRKGKLPPLGMDRAAQWGHDTEVLRSAVLQKLFGFLSAPHDTEDERLRGLGLDPKLFTMAMLIRPEFVETWLRWNAKRRKGGDQVESYSFYDLYVLEGMVCDLRPKTGWLRQRPDLANHLRPVAGYVDTDFIKRAKKDWDKVCDEALASYLTLSAQIEEVAEEQRDPFEPILPLLDLDHPQYHDPITALKIFSRNIINDLADHSVAPLKAARQVRGYLVARVLSATALRSRNLRELTYRDDNKGQLRRKGGKWYILLPWHRFKNKHSSFFGPKRKKQDYEKELADKDGLYDWLEEYIKVHRPVLLAGRESEIFFVATGENPMFTPTRFSGMYRRLTMSYFAFNPYLNRGIPGVKPHGPHAVRDMIATFILQSTGSYELAAFAICDTTETVKKHYGRFGPKDKTRLVDSIINAAWDANPDGNTPNLTLPLWRPPSDPLV